MKVNIQHELNHLDKVIHYLDKPNIKLPFDPKLSKNLIKIIISKVYVRMNRFWNLLFGDHHWYSEARARRLVIHYITNIDVSKKSDKQILQIVDIYDRLIRLKKGKGSWGDEINRDDIIHSAKKQGPSNRDKHVANADLPGEHHRTIEIYPHNQVEERKESLVVDKNPPIPKTDPLLENPSPSVIQTDLHNSDQIVIQTDVNNQIEEKIEDGDPVVEHLPIPKTDPLLENPSPSVIQTDVNNQIEEAIEDPVVEDLPSPEVDPLLENSSESPTRSKNPHRFVYLNNFSDPSMKLLFHSLADAFGNNSDWEGWNSSEALKFLSEYLQKMIPNCQKKQQDNLTNILAQCQETLDIKNPQIDRAFIKNKIETAFNCNKPLLILGGWCGKPNGHALSYEVIPQDNGKANFRIYNSGRGSDKYHAGAYDGNKIKKQAYVEWPNLSKEQLTGDAFLQAIKELVENNILPDGFTYTAYDENDVYEGFRALLGAESTSLPDQSAMITGQRSGTCPMKCLWAFLRTRMPEEEYKQLNIGFRLQILHDAVTKTLVNPSHVTVENWRLVKKSHQTLSRSIIALYRKEYVGDLFIQDAKNALLPVAAWIKANAKVRFPKGTLNQNLTLRDDIKPIAKPDFCADPRLVDANLGQTQNSAQPCRFVLEKFEGFSGVSPSTELSQICDLAKEEFAHFEDISVQKGIIDYISKLSIDPTFWRKECLSNPNNAKKIIADLGDLTKQLYLTCCSVPTASIIFSERLYAISKILYIQDALTEVGGIVSSNAMLGFNIDLFEEMLSSRNLFYRHFDSSKQIELHTICKRLHRTTALNICSGLTLNKEKPIFSAEAVLERSSSGGESVSGFIYYIRHFEKKWLMDFFKAPENAHLIKESSQVQDSHIFASKKLPEWLKAMRDADLIFTHLSHGNVSRLLDIDRQSTAEFFEFEVKHQVEKCPIDIKIAPFARASNDIDPSKSKLIFRNQYRSFKNPNLAALVETYLSNKLSTKKEFSEKDLLGDDQKNHNMGLSQEESKEIAHLFSCSTTQVVETLEYFTKHTEKLKEPDYQILLLFLMFENNLLGSQLNVLGFPNKLLDFVKKNHERALAEDETQLSVFLCQLSRYLKSFFPSEPYYRESLNRLRPLLNRQELEYEERSAIWAEILAHHAEMNSMSDEDLKEFLVGHIYLQEHPLPTEWKDPITEKALNESLHHHASRLRNALLQNNVPNQAFLNAILKTTRPGEKDYEWDVVEKVGSFPKFSTRASEHILYPLQGLLVSPKQEVLLPFAIREHPHFKQLFPETKKGTFSNGVWEFYTAKGLKTLIKLKGETLVVDQQRENNGINDWYRFIPASNFFEQKSYRISNSLSSAYLTHNYTHWMPLDQNQGSESLIIVNPKTDKAEYKVLKANSGENIIRLKDGAILSKYDEYLNNVPAANTFNHFESHLFVHQWHSENTQDLKQIEFSRLGLVFEPESPKSKKLICKQFPDFHLAFNKSIKQLGSYPHYLVLEDDQKRQKILLPQFNFLPNEKKEVFSPNFKVDYKISPDRYVPQTFYDYDVNKHGKLISKSREANLFLSEALLLVQEYKHSAFNLRQHGEKLSSYTLQENSILENISRLEDVTGDMYADAHAIRAYASYLLLKNEDANHHPLKHLKEAAVHYKKYLQSYRHAQQLKFTRSEELYLLKHCLSQDFDHIMYLRLKELDPTAAQNLKKSIDLLELNNGAIKSIDALSLDNMNWPTLVGSLKKPASYLLTRIGPPLERSFLYFYDVARIGNEKEKQDVKNAALFLSKTGNESQRALGIFFLIVLKNPNEFTTIISLSKWDEVENWKKQTIKKAKSLISSISPVTSSPPSISPKQSMDLRGHHHHLDEKQTPLGHMEVPLNLNLRKSLSKECQEAVFFTATPQNEKKDCHKKFSAFLDEQQGNTPLESQEWNRLKEQQQAYLKIPSPPLYGYGTRGLDGIRTFLNKPAQLDLEDLKKKLLDLANKTPTSAIEKDHDQIWRWGNLRKKMSIDELIINFARREPELLKLRNPALQDKDIKLLYKQIGEYLIFSTYEQQKARAAETLSKIDSVIKKNGPGSQEETDLIQQLAQDLLSERMYDPNQHPAYLVFEHYADILMRPNQVEKLELFLTKGDSNPIVEMIMSSGKSKVLLPLLGLLRADGKALSMLIVPQSLYESISSDTQQILRTYFAQSLHSLHFDRNTTFTKESLQGIYDELTSIQSNRQCLIMTNKSALCLLLKFIEKCAQHFSSGEKLEGLNDELKLMIKILDLLKQNGFPIIDEVDTILNVMREICFSIGNKHPPRQSEIEIVSHIFGLLYENQSVRDMKLLERNPTLNKDDPVLTEPGYHQTIKPALVDAFINSLATIQMDLEGLGAKLRAFSGTLNDQNRESLKWYLTRQKEHLKEAQNYYDSLDEEIRNVLSLAGEQFENLLPHTLTRVWNVNYGIDKKSHEILPIPFDGSDNPLKGSQFANPYVTMNYTIQSYVKEGISRDVVINLINHLQKKATQQKKEGDGVPLTQTQAWKAFCILKGDLDIPLYNCKKHHYDAVTNRINQSFEAKKNIITNVILPQLELYDSKLVANAHNLIALFKKLSGFTGTLWNSDSMDHKIIPVPEQGIDAKTLNLLYEHSANKIVTINSGSTESMLTELTEKVKAQYGEFDLLCDSGGYLKDGGNEFIAQKLCELKKTPTVYYSESGEQSLMENGKSIPLSHSSKKVDERSTFLDQSHAIGADVKQKRNAVGLVTIGREMLLRDLLQSVWRLRELDKSQRILFVLSEEVKGIIREMLELPAMEEIEFTHILRFAVMNQAKQQGKDNFKAFKQELWNIPQQMLLEVLMKPDLEPNAYLEVFNQFQSLWFQDTFLTPDALYGQLVLKSLSQDVVSDEKTKCVKYMENAFTQMPWLSNIGFSKDKCVKDIDSICKSFEGKLPEKIMAKQSAKDQSVQVEQEMHMEVGVEVEIHMHQQEQKQVKLGFIKAAVLDEKKSVKDCFKPKDSFLPYFPMNSYFQEDLELAEYANAFEGIYLTTNVLEFEENDKNSLAARPIKLLGEHRTPFHHILFEGDQIIVLSQYEAERYVSEPSYYNLTLGFNDPSRQLSEEEFPKIVKLKFLNGESTFTEREIKALADWFRELGAEKMRKLYYEKILAGFPKKAESYKNSDLQKLFRTMCSMKN